MQNLKKKAISTNSDNGEIPKQKERHIVSWSQEEDDILREQIRIHGTENWAIIASNFKDKSTRQCRRRWFTYLNSDFKKGGWSPEEDMLLCEAQRIFGNRWTEIAKVVSGRTDNAVKNRFSTLCKKRTRHEALAKENNTSYINLNNKRVLFNNGLYTDGISVTTAPFKKMRRSHISDVTENHNHGEKLVHEQKTHEQLRAPFAVLVQNFQRAGDFPTQHHGNNTKEICNDESDTKLQGTFLKKDDPKIHALMQQAELLSSLALKVNAENTDQSLENAWKMLQDFLNQTKDDDMLRDKMSDSEVQLDDLMNLVEDLRTTIEGSQQSWRQHDLYDESPGSSENSTGSTLVPDTRGDKADQNQCEIRVKSEDFVGELQSSGIGEQNNLCESGQIILSNANIGQDFIEAEMLPFCEELKVDNEAAIALSSTNFNSPLQVTPIFRSLAAGIPSPKFSESERSFLLKTFGLESASPIANTNPSQHPPCKRALLHSL